MTVNEHKHCDEPNISYLIPMEAKALAFLQPIPCARPTNGIAIEFEIQSQLGIHMSWQLHCSDVCKIALWSVEYISNQSSVYFGRFANSIEILLVGRTPWQLICQWHKEAGHQQPWHWSSLPRMFQFKHWEDYQMNIDAFIGLEFIDACTTTWCLGGLELDLIDCTCMIDVRWVWPDMPTSTHFA